MFLVLKVFILIMYFYLRFVAMLTSYVREGIVYSFTFLKLLYFSVVKNNVNLFL